MANDNKLLESIAAAYELQAKKQEVTFLDPAVAKKVSPVAQIFALVMFGLIKSKGCKDFLEKASQLSVEDLQRLLVIDRYLHRASRTGKEVLGWGQIGIDHGVYTRELKRF